MSASANPNITGIGNGGITYVTINNAPTAGPSNAAAINAALALGGNVYVPPGLGDVYINSTLTIPSNTNFVVGAGTRIRLASGSNCVMLNNTNWNAPMKSVTSVSSTDGKTVTVVFGATHNLPVGSYFFLIGCVPDTYNGVWLVKSVSTTTNPNDTLTYTLSSHLNAEVPLITSPATINPGYIGTYFGTNTIMASAADYNISISGATWDRDVNNNSGVTGYQEFGFFLRRIYNLSITNMTWFNCRNPIVAANIYSGYYDQIDCKNIGSLVQHSGSCRNIKIGSLRGDAWDDHTTFLIGDYAGYADITTGTWYGDMDVIRVDTIQSLNAFRFVKLLGQANFKHGVISFGSLQGRSGLGSAAMFTVQDDTLCTTMAGVTGAAGTYVENLGVDSLENRDTSSFHGIDIQNATVNVFTIGRFTWNMVDVAGCVGIAVKSSATVNTMNVETLNLNAAAYAVNAFGLLQDATIGTLNINKLIAKNIGQVFIQGSNATNNTTINITSIIANNCGQMIKVTKGGTVLNVNFALRGAYQLTPAFQIDGNCNINVAAGQGLLGTDAFGGTGANKVLGNCLGIGIDVGGTGVIRTAGAMTIHSSGTARSTLVSGNAVVCDNTATTGSWKQLSNSALVF